MKPIMRGLCVLLMTGLVLAGNAEARRSTPDVDFLELAALLARDGNYDRAENALAQVDADAEGLDRVKYHTVRGLIALHFNRLDEAASAFELAIAAGQQEPVVFLYLAQARFGLERFEAALEALDLAGESAEALSGAWLMRAHALWMLGRPAEAFAALDRASARFPDNTAFMRRQVFYLVELGLYQEAGDLGQRYLARTEGSEEDYVAIGNALRRSRQFALALSFLEAARLKYPESVNVTRVLAQTYLDMGRPLSAAELYESLSRRDPKLIAETAELYRRGGRLFRALDLNAQVADSPTRLRQRVGLLIELGRYDQVTGMEEALARNGLLADEDIRYALAFAWFKAGDYDAAERHLAPLTRTDLFRRATELRRIMQECAAERWRCA